MMKFECRVCGGEALRVAVYPMQFVFFCRCCKRYGILRLSWVRNVGALAGLDQGAVSHPPKKQRQRAKSTTERHAGAPVNSGEAVGVEVSGLGVRA